VKPGGNVPPAANPEIADRPSIETQTDDVRGGGGGIGAALNPATTLSPAAETIARIAQLQRTRTFCIRAQSRADRSTDAFIARECLGYSTALPERDRKAIMGHAIRIRLAGERPLKQAMKRGRSRSEARGICAPDGRDRLNSGHHDRLVPPVELPELDDEVGAGDQSLTEARDMSVPNADRRDRNKGEAQPTPVPPVALPIIQMSFIGRMAADDLRRRTEREMEKLAATLRVSHWQAGVHGFGKLGLAIIVAEAGRDLRCYPTVSKLWKRLGLAVIDGERQRRKSDPVLALLHGFTPRRRGEMWTLSESLLFAQWNAGKDGAEGSPAGPYGEVYRRRRAHTAETHPEWTKAHARDDARRVMFKSLIADLWGEWRRLAEEEGDGK
jgi:hypothetical protein